MQEFTKKEKISGKRMGYLCVLLAVFCILLTVTLITLGYFVSFQDDEAEIRDGLNRLLDEVPAALSFLPQWSGYIWFIIDLLILLALIIVIDKLFVKSKTYFTGIKNVDF